MSKWQFLSTKRNHIQNTNKKQVWPKNKGAFFVKSFLKLHRIFFFRRKTINLFGVVVVIYFAGFFLYYIMTCHRMWGTFFDARERDERQGMGFIGHRQNLHALIIETFTNLSLTMVFDWRQHVFFLYEEGKTFDGETFSFRHFCTFFLRP